MGDFHRKVKVESTSLEKWYPSILASMAHNPWMISNKTKERMLQKKKIENHKSEAINCFNNGDLEWRSMKTVSDPHKRVACSSKTRITSSSLCYTKRNMKAHLHSFFFHEFWDHPDLHKRFEQSSIFVSPWTNSKMPKKYLLSSKCNLDLKVTNFAREL